MIFYNKVYIVHIFKSTMASFSNSTQQSLNADGKNYSVALYSLMTLFFMMGKLAKPTISAA